MDSVNRIEIEPELLEALYWGNELFIRQIAELFNCGSSTILKKMEKHKIERRNCYILKKIIIEPELFWGLRWGHGLTNKEIAKIFNCSLSPIGKVVKKHNIPFKEEIYVNCANCGKSFKIRLCEYKKAKRFFCRNNSKCLKEYGYPWSRGKNNSRWKGGVKRLLYKEYERNAKNCKRKFKLSFEEFSNIIKQPCFYSRRLKNIPCKTKSWGENEKLNGIDRIDNDKGYTIDNCVPCDKDVNVTKGSFSQSEFARLIVDCYPWALNFLNKDVI